VLSQIQAANACASLVLPEPESPDNIRNGFAKREHANLSTNFSS